MLGPHEVIEVDGAMRVGGAG